MQAGCLLGHGFSKELLRAYVAASGRNYESQQQLLRWVGHEETAGAKRKRLEREVRELRSTPTTGAAEWRQQQRDLAELEAEFQLLTDICGVGVAGKAKVKRDTVPLSGVELE